MNADKRWLVIGLFFVVLFVIGSIIGYQRNDSILVALGTGLQALLVGVLGLIVWLVVVRLMDRSAVEDDSQP